MQYLGGKWRLRNEIAWKLCAARDRDHQLFVSLFCGALSVESRVDGFKRMILNDAHPYLIACHRAVQSGWEPPERVTEQEYCDIRANIDKYPPELVGFVGFSCSFCGKWFDGYARNCPGDNDSVFARRGATDELSKIARLHSAEFLNLDYREVKISNLAVIYCDPPYANTTGYKGVDKFDSAAFWEYAAKLAADGHKVFVSEESAPPGTKCVFEKQYTRGAKGGDGKNKIAVERLYRL